MCLRVCVCVSASEFVKLMSGVFGSFCSKQLRAGLHDFETRECYLACTLCVAEVIVLFRFTFRTR